jgi:hypothetical protein
LANLSRHLLLGVFVVHDSIPDIPCRLRSAAARDALKSVLDTIRSAQPEDYLRLLRVVKEVVPLAPEETEDGTMGEWKQDLADDDPATWDYGVGETPGVLYIDESHTPTELIAILAHELGHACTVVEDREAREAPSDEWASEATADWYAVRRWDFGTEMEVRREGRDRLHHGPWPGETVEAGKEKVKFILGEDYVFRKVD